MAPPRSPAAGWPASWDRWRGGGAKRRDSVIRHSSGAAAVQSVFPGREAEPRRRLARRKCKEEEGKRKMVKTSGKRRQRKWKKRRMRTLCSLFKFTSRVCVGVRVGVCACVCIGVQSAADYIDRFCVCSILCMSDPRQVYTKSVEKKKCTAIKIKIPWATLHYMK